jgi:hypothetical protein
MDNAAPDNSDTGTLPPLYARWISELLGGPIPEETKATCHDCAMCAKPGQTAASPVQMVFFNPKSKCCTYMPDLPNFLVGRILNEPNPAFVPGRAAVISRLENKAGATLLGLNHTRAFDVLYNYGASQGAFGRSQTLRCPYYVEEGGLCGVWKHRNSICTTWFCKHNRGAVGLVFWQNIQQLLSQVEESLARWCTLQLNPGLEALQNLFPTRYQLVRQSAGDNLRNNELDDEVDPQNYARNWGSWANREHEFYLECARLVSELSWPEVLSLCGPEVAIKAQLCLAAYDKLISDEIPEYLRVGQFKLVQVGPTHNRVEAYRAYQPLDIPKALLDALYYFDGQRPTGEVLTALAAEKGLKVTLSLVRKLVDFEVLIPA